MLYNAAIALVKAAGFVKPLDPTYSFDLLNKAQEYKDKIVVDEKLEKEVKDFEQEIRKGL
jgi:hypothetical protein